MKDSGRMGTKKVREYFTISNNRKNILDNLLIIFDKEKGLWSMNKEKAIKANLLITKERVMGYYYTKMSPTMKVIG